MRRTWQIEADAERQLPTGEIVPFVSREALMEGLLDVAAIFDRAGGVVTLLGARTPTNLEGEMLTSHVVIEWKDRTDAKPQPERPALPDPVPQVPMLDAEDVDPVESQADPVGDGLDGAELPEEDLTSIPASAR